jgi:hypothetical protein
VEKKIQNNRLKTDFNTDLTLEETADLLKHKRMIDLEAVIDNIKERFQTSRRGAKKYKRNTSDYLVALYVPPLNILRFDNQLIRFSTFYKFSGVH